MSRLSFSTAYLTGILVFVLSACAPSQIETENVSVRTPTPTLPLPTPSAAFTPTLTLLVPTPSPTFTPVPTLPAEGAYDLLANWLQNNNDCQLPCWGGLTPSKSLALEAYSKLMPFSTL